MYLHGHLEEKAKLDDNTNVVFYSYDLKTSEQTNTNPYLLARVSWIAGNSG